MRQKCQIFLCFCSFWYDSKCGYDFGLRKKVRCARDKTKHVRSSGRLLRCSALSAPREGLDRHSPGFTFLNPGVTALSEDSTEATSPAEINKRWHTEHWRHTWRQEEGPPHIQKHMQVYNDGYFVLKSQKTVQAPKCQRRGIKNTYLTFLLEHMPYSFSKRDWNPFILWWN